MTIPSKIIPLIHIYSIPFVRNYLIEKRLSLRSSMVRPRIRLLTKHLRINWASYLFLDEDNILLVESILLKFITDIAVLSQEIVKHHHRCFLMLQCIYNHHRVIPNKQKGQNTFHSDCGFTSGMKLLSNKCENGP